MTNHETLTESMFIKVFFALIGLTTLTFFNYNKKIQSNYFNLTNGLNK